jgi:hypothetical protein
MKIKTKKTYHWSGFHYKVFINGVKYPKARGEYYQPFGLNEEKNRLKAIEWGIAESKGKYLSSGGIIYNSKDEYLELQELSNN